MSTRRPSAGPTIRRPRGGVYGDVRIVYVEGRGYYVQPTDPAALPSPRSTLALCRRWRDALAFVESGAAAAVLHERLTERGAA